ncbi:MAG: NAD-dependent epimerase/dehydratase family protein [Planctomycetes bacterium]|nr:NAD-dependent epimerase/dehydratase family protein [Planctomycetota bacterium]
MDIFVTGGTGFLGKHVVAKLLADGHTVRCLVRPTSEVEALRSTVSEEQRPRLHFVPGQLQKLTPDLLAGCDAVCHIAAAMKGATAALFVDNVIGVRKLLKVTAEAGTKRVVLISSLAVYDTSGLKNNDVLDETCPLEPQPQLRDPYTYSKLAGEQVAWEAYRAGQCPLVVIRPGVIYGPGRDPLSSRVGLNFGKLLIKMGGSQRLPYVRVEACAAGIALAVTTPGIEGQAFNLLDGELVRARTFLRYYRRGHRGLWVIPVPGWAIGPLAKFNVWYSKRSHGQIPPVLTPYKCNAMWKPLQYSVEKAKSVLGWVPQPNTLDGVQGL